MHPRSARSSHLQRWAISTLPNGQLCIRDASGGLIASMEAGSDYARQLDARYIVESHNESVAKHDERARHFSKEAHHG